MKKIILSLAAITYSIAAFNQISSTDIEWGDYTEEVVVNPTSYFTSGNQKDLYLVTKPITYYRYSPDFLESLGRFFITKYNVNTLEMEYAKSFNVGSSNTQDELTLPTTIVSRGNNIRVFSNKIIPKDDVVIAYGQLIDSVGQMGDPIEIGSYVNKENKSEGKFTYPYTKDEDEVLSVMIHPMDKYDYVKFTYKIMDGEFNELFKTEISLPYKYKNFTFKTYPSVREGSLYLTGWLDEDEKYVFLKYDIETEEVKTFVLDDFEGEQQATGIEYIFQDDSTVVITGYYEDEGIKAKKKKALGKNDGIYYGLVNATTFEKISFETIAFDSEAKEILLDEKELKKGLKPSLFSTPNFIGSRDGGGMIYNKQFQKKKYVRSKQLFFTGIDTLGNTSWSSYIPLNQELYNIPYTYKNKSRLHAGYDYHIIDGGLYFIYATHEKNVETFNSIPPNKHKTLKKEKHAVAMISKLNSNGSVKTTPLVEGEDVGEVMIIPTLTYNTKDGKLMFFSYIRGESIYDQSRIGMIQFEVSDDEKDEDENAAEEEANDATEE